MYIYTVLFIITSIGICWFLTSTTRSRLIEECRYLRARGNSRLCKKYQKIFRKALSQSDTLFWFFVLPILVSTFAVGVFGYTFPTNEQEHRLNSFLFFGVFLQCTSFTTIVLLIHFIMMRRYDKIACETNEKEQEKAIAGAKKILMRSS